MEKVGFIRDLDESINIDPSFGTTTRNLALSYRKF